MNIHTPKQGALYTLRDGHEYVLSGPDLSDPGLYLVPRGEVVLVLATEPVLSEEGEPVLMIVAMLLPRLGRIRTGSHHVSLNWDERWRQLC